MNVSGKVPEVDPIVLKSVMNAILSAMGLVVSCHDISEGGLAISICEMLIGGDVGAEIDLSPLRGRSDYKLFSESNTRWVVEIKKEKSYLFEGMMKDKGIEAYSIGIIGGSDLIVYDGKKELIDLPVEDIRHAWEEFSEYMW
jgi:phosphoribosylformylglycinamidine synthase